MSETHTKDHPVPAIILLLIICGLVAWGLGIMAGNTGLGIWAGVVLFVVGTYFQLALGPDGDSAH